MTDTKLVVGLGNPGSEYADTRHNMGFMVVDSLSAKLGIDTRKRKFGGRFGEGRFLNKKLILLKPQQFMNRSGQSVATAVGFYQLDPDDLLVITDDMALDPGKIRLRPKGSAGGHNGLSDIIAKLGTSDFGRLRIGVGKSPYPRWRDYVLGKPTKEEIPLLSDAVARAVDAVQCWAADGIDAAMNRFNAN